MITIVHIIDPWDHAGPLNWSHSHGGLRLINPCEYATVIWSCFYHAHYNKLSDQKLFGVIMHRYVRTTSPVSFASATDAAHAHICILKTLLLLVGDVWNLSVFVALSQHCADALTPVMELWRYLDNRRCTFRWGHLVHQCVPPPGQIWYVFNQIPVRSCWTVCPVRDQECVACAQRCRILECWHFHFLLCRVVLRHSLSFRKPPAWMKTPKGGRGISTDPSSLYTFRSSLARANLEQLFQAISQNNLPSPHGGET